jgi:tRNA (guanine37-N1)-methyltransferase
MRFDILTLFPRMFCGPFDESIIARARTAGLIQIHIHNIRDYAEGKHKVTDDYPFGGGPGMVMKPQPIFDCLAAVRPLTPEPGRVILLTPQGRVLNQAIVRELARLPRLILICGHYEGVDERVREALVEDEISIGDYIVSGGEIAAIVLVDAVAREVPGVVGSRESLREESHASGLLEYPQYTRPAVFRGMAVPDILLSGHHGEIAKWRRRQSILRTALRRPDLLARAQLTDEERAWLAEQLTALGRGPDTGDRLTPLPPQPPAEARGGTAADTSAAGHVGPHVADGQGGGGSPSDEGT